MSTVCVCFQHLASCAQFNFITVATATTGVCIKGMLSATCRSTMESLVSLNLYSSSRTSSSHHGPTMPSGQNCTCNNIPVPALVKQTRYSTKLNTCKHCKTSSCTMHMHLLILCINQITIFHNLQQHNVISTQDLYADYYCCYDHRTFTATAVVGYNRTNTAIAVFYSVLGGLSGRYFLTAAAGHLNSASFDCVNAGRVSPVSHTTRLPPCVLFPTPDSQTKTTLPGQQGQSRHCTK